MCPKNETRRVLLADAGLRVLSQQGARGLTHRAVDAEAGVPVGTASNYFRSRKELVRALVDRIGERLAPGPEVVARPANREPNRALLAEYMRDVVRRLTAERDVTLALFELRLEATRRQEIAETITGCRRSNFAAATAFSEDAGLPGDAPRLALFHYAIDGLLLDRLNASIDPDRSTDEVVDALVAGLLPERRRA